jgi:hypothetical protein
MNAPSNFSLGFSQELKRSGSVSGDPMRNGASLKWSNRGRRDMSTFTFTLTLLLLGTVGAAQSDNAMFWLLIGPAPFTVLFAGLVFFRQGFGPRRVGKTAALHPEHHTTCRQAEARRNTLMIDQLSGRTLKGSAKHFSLFPFNSDTRAPQIHL